MNLKYLRGPHGHYNYAFSFPRIYMGVEKKSLTIPYVFTIWQYLPHLRTWTPDQVVMNFTIFGRMRRGHHNHAYS